jgi:hypothetical protein
MHIGYHVCCIIFFLLCFSKETIMDELFLDRQHLIEANLPALTKLMRTSGIDHPFGLALDVRDHHARQFALALHQSEQEIDELVRAHEGKKIPTFLAVITWEQARLAFPHTSPTAIQSLDTLWLLCKDGQYAAVAAVSEGGNGYRLVPVNPKEDDMPRKENDHE